MEKDEYFSWRNVDAIFYDEFQIPKYFHSILYDKSAAILDFGCGFGQLLLALKSLGFSSLEGAEINLPAITHLRNRGVLVHDLSKSRQFYENRRSSYDFVIMSHVLEHLPKDKIISKLKQLRKLLKKYGRLVVVVPNAQSSTGCYWAYEDFTHHTLFTAGSLYYVLRAAGFSHVEFVDLDCTSGMPPMKKFVQKFLLGIYHLNVAFWNKVTASAFHSPSPQIFSYEIKAVACV